MTSSVFFENYSRQQKGKLMIKELILVFLLFLVVELSNVEATAASNGTNSRREVRIISKGGKYLSIKKRKVQGNNTNNSYAKLELYSTGLNGEVTIKGVKCRKYLVINRAGKINLRKMMKTSAVFINVHVSGGFHSFMSKLYRKYYLAITSTGLVTTSTDKNSDDVQFAVFTT